MSPATILRPLLAATVLAAAGAVPPGRQHVLTVEGENTVTFVPQAGLAPVAVEYRARVEYVVDTRSADDPAGPAGDAAKPAAKKPAARGRSKASKAAAKAAGRVDLSVHSATFALRQNGQPVFESRMDRSRFQGQPQPGAPAVDVTAANAPPRLAEILKTFDRPAATLYLDADAKVIGRELRSDAPLHALVETLLSVHTPIPRDVGTWEAPTRLAMGQGQTARGTLRFEKDKDSLARSGGLVTAKVSGTLRAEGVVVGQFIKDGTYKVTGEQSYDPETREWRSARWSVEIDNELANQGGQTVAHARGTMTLQSRAVEAPKPAPAGARR